MHRRELDAALAEYPGIWLSDTARHASFDAREERDILARFRAFVAATPDCFDRSSPEGHITGSALVTSPSLDQVLLTLHGKLGLWLQLGGHSDGDPRPDAVARREVEEESGIRDLAFLDAVALLGHGPGRRPVLPFDFDAHLIPARKGEPAHVHYDVRFLIVADRAAPLVITNESKDLKWFTLEEARRVTAERSMRRQFDKLEHLRGRLTGALPVLS
jgi:8-oxo-dGTP pyrophosphatase MutT (NUDIX family)